MAVLSYILNSTFSLLYKVQDEYNEIQLVNKITRTYIGSNDTIDILFYFEQRNLLTIIKERRLKEIKENIYFQQYCEKNNENEDNCIKKLLHHAKSNNYLWTFYDYLVGVLKINNLNIHTVDNLRIYLRVLFHVTYGIELKSSKKYIYDKKDQLHNDKDYFIENIKKNIYFQQYCNANFLKGFKDEQGICSDDDYKIKLLLNFVGPYREIRVFHDYINSSIHDGISDIEIFREFYENLDNLFCTRWVFH